MAVNFIWEIFSRFSISAWRYETAERLASAVIVRIGVKSGLFVMAEFSKSEVTVSLILTAVLQV